MCIVCVFNQRGEALPLRLGGLRLEVCTFGWAHSPLQEAHGSSAVSVSEMRPGLFQVGPPCSAHEETLMRLCWRRTRWQTAKGFEGGEANKQQKSLYVFLEPWTNSSSTHFFLKLAFKLASSSKTSCGVHGEKSISPFRSLFFSRLIICTLCEWLDKTSQPGL